MIATIKKWFEQSSSASSNQADDKAIYLAALALLIETAKADSQLDEAELQTVLDLAKSEFKVANEDHAELVELAKDSANSATSLYEFTSIINETFDDEQKFKLILGMWKVAFADGQIDRYEEHLIRKVAELIYIPHVRFIEAKHIAGEQH